MDGLKAVTQNVNSAREFPEQVKRELLLASIRRARNDLQTRVYELDEIGVSLRYNMISPEGAVAWVYHIGAEHLINSEPWPNRIEAA